MRVFLIASLLFVVKANAGALVHKPGKPIPTETKTFISELPAQLPGGPAGTPPPYLTTPPSDAKVVKAPLPVSDVFNIRLTGSPLFIQANKTAAQVALINNPKLREFLAHLKYQLNQNQDLRDIAKKENGHISLTFYSDACESQNGGAFFDGQYLNQAYSAHFATGISGCDVTEIPDFIQRLVNGLRSQIQVSKSNVNPAQETQNLVQYLENQDAN